MSRIDDPTRTRKTAMNVSETLQHTPDLEKLGGALRARCCAVGRLRRLDLIPNPDAGCVVCRLEAASARDRDAFAREFGGSVIGSGLYFDIPLHRSLVAG